MKHKTFQSKIFVLSSILLVIILFGIFCSRTISNATNTKSSGVIEYINLTSLEKEKINKEVELKEILYDYDKKNIVQTSVYLEDLNNEITRASIFIVGHKEIIDSAQRDKIVSLAAESLNLDIEDISVDYMDVKTFTSLGNKR